MTTEPFPAPQDAHPANGTAPLQLVTAEMMDHAAHLAAERADAVAHEPPEAAAEPEPQAPSDAEGAAPPEPEPAVVEAVAAANENAAVPSRPPEDTPRGTLQPADLAFNHGRSADPAADRAGRAVAGPIDSIGLFGAKIVEIGVANMTAAGDFVSALLAARTVSEVAAINADHMRRRLDAMTTQGRELLLLAQKAALEAVRATGGGPHGS